ncbi:winged helix-turn-helix domain-containing protein [Rheinheimera pleomorphica]|uniref:winged helix-turn-helix domain-containing protein n=1 Tax=Rheinheimera pleomorphica TaxID=2703963 RepID=UPI00141E6016|nr:winged helix-turn-helix domain-containing protein [Rheinheimera pleomorphica]
MNLVSIGEFTVDLDERRIFRQQTELAAEPKVIEVLCYLIEHRERFVSLNELHENVWAGRVVTDTAVRRTISKLRVLLEDSEAENPRYIKSQMKRGYQLVCSVGTESVAVPQFSPGPAVVAVNPGKKALPTKPILFCLVLAILMLATIYYLYAQPQRSLNQLVQTETLLSIPGQKTSLSISKDGRWQAFVSKIDNSSNWELYLYDAKAGQLQKIETPTEHCRFVSFIDNDSRLAYVGYDGSEAKLYTQSVVNLAEAPVLHPTAPFQLLGNSVELAKDKILIAAAKSISDNFHYYKYDLLTNSFEQFTYSSEDGIQDAFATISADRQFLALGRANLYKKNMMLQIYRIADKELIAEYKLQDSLRDFRISWRDNNNLLTRIGDKLYLIAGDTGERTAIAAEPHPLHEFSFSQTGELYALSYQRSEPNIYQARWPLADNFNKSYQLGTNIRTLSFGQDADTLWLVEKEHNLQRLYRYSDNKNLRQLVMESPEPITLQDQTKDGEFLLLKRNNRLEIFNTITAESTTVSVSTQDVRTGNFSQTGDFVFFTERVKDQWLVKRYSLADNTQRLLLQDYMYIQDIADGYVAADSSGNVWRLDTDYNRTGLLYKGVLFDLEYQFIVRDDKLVMAYRTFMGDWILADINLTSHQIWQRSIAFHDFSVPFSIDSNGLNLIFKTNIKEENQLVKYGYNFGYN